MFLVNKLWHFLSIFFKKSQPPLYLSLVQAVRFAEVDGALPAVSLTQWLVEGRADEYAATFGHGRRLRGGQTLIQGSFGRGFHVLLALLHAQVQRAILIHLYGHVLRVGEAVQRSNVTEHTQHEPRHLWNFVNILITIKNEPY